MFGLRKNRKSEVCESPVKELIEMLGGEDADKYFKLEPRSWVVGLQFQFKMKPYGNSILCINNTEDQYTRAERKALSQALSKFVNRRFEPEAHSRECLKFKIDQIKEEEFKRASSKSAKRECFKR